jgi:hypothetical protein
MNIPKKFSLHTLFRVLQLSIAKDDKDEFRRFLVQQNLIQYQLISLVKMSSGIIDSDFCNWVENKVTLGSLINIYKICAHNTDKEIQLVKKLKNYNTKRNNIIHKLMQEKYQKEIIKRKDIDFGVKSANDLGYEIIESLNQVISERIKMVNTLLKINKI